MPDGRYPGAIWLPGPRWKVGYIVFGRTSKKDSVIDHSADGPFQAAIDVLNSPRLVSWQFTNDDSGLYQHYEIEDVCWHAGFQANKRCVGVESTGKDEPLTERQYQHLVGLHRWLRERGVLTVCERRVDLWEHNEWRNTDCPSGRIPWARLIEDLKEEDMKPPLYQILGRPEVYALSVGGIEYEHIPDQKTFRRRGYKDEDVQVVGPDDGEIWDDLTALPVKYLGVPPDLR